MLYGRVLPLTQRHGDLAARTQKHRTNDRRRHRFGHSYAKPGINGTGKNLLGKTLPSKLTELKHQATPLVQNPKTPAAI